MTPVLAYYIYYRIDPACAAQAEQRVRAMQAGLDCKTGVAGRLLKKRGEPHLWMEIYEEVEDADAFEQALAEAVNGERLLELLKPGTDRSIECFVMGNSPARI